MRRCSIAIALGAFFIAAALPARVYAQDPHAGHGVAVVPSQEAARPPQGPAQAEELGALLARAEAATGEAKVALLTELVGRLVAAQATPRASCGGAGHSCPMCAQHKGTTATTPDAAAAEAR